MITLVLGVLLGVSSQTHLVWAEPPHEAQGLVSQEDGDLLVIDSRQAMADGKYADAVRLLKRLLSRYPAHPEANRSKSELGRALLSLGKPKEAIPFLLQAVEAWGTNAEGIRIRLFLTRAYVESRDLKAATIAATETLALAMQRNLSPEIQLEAHLLRAQAYLAENKRALLLNALSSADTLAAMIKNAPSALLAERDWIKAQIQAQECVALMRAKALSEAELKERVTQAGLCLQEATLEAKKAIARDAKPWSEKAAGGLRSLGVSYALFCQKPPPPRGRRSSTELKKYTEEAAMMLRPLCSKQLEQAAESLRSTQPTLQDGSPAKFQLQKLSEEILHL